MDLKELNEIPARTFRWLNVNTVSLNDINIQSKNYNCEYLSSTNIDGVILEKNTAANIQKVLGSSSEIYKGVDKDLLKDNLNKFNAGFNLVVKKDVNVKQNICINYNINETNNMLIDTNTIKVEENSNVNIYINFLGNENEQAYHQGYTHILVGKNATAKVVFIQNLSSNTTNIQSIFANVEDNAKVSVVIAEVGSLNTVVNSNINLTGNNSKGYINSIYVANNNKKVDLNYLINHFGKNSVSDSQTKGVLLDTSKKVFKGGIKFYKGAKSATGALGENVLLLSSVAKNSSVPLLLCDEDDVKGEHVASVGKIDENILFYLMTRGLNEEEAKKVFLHAYFNPVIDLIEDDKLKNEIENSIYKKVDING